jgi:hypothetical protein
MSERNEFLVPRRNTGVSCAKARNPARFELLISSALVTIQATTVAT